MYIYEDLFQEVQLEDRLDDIVWWFSANGTYSSSSAYLAQFIANVPDHDWERLSNIKAEIKCKLFAWLILQKQIVGD